MDATRTAYRELSPDEAGAVRSLKAAINAVIETLQAGADGRGVGPFEVGETDLRRFHVAADPRCLALARTKLEEAAMWATKAITG